MNDTIIKMISRFSRHGVLHREAVKNDIGLIKKLVRAGFVRKIYKSGRVFYELTQKALPLLEQQRKIILEEANMLALMEPKMAELIEDIRFLNENSKEAEELLFLGDWQLTRPVVPAELELAKLRYYETQVTERVRKKRAA